MNQTTHSSAKALGVIAAVAVAAVSLLLFTVAQANAVGPTSVCKVNEEICAAGNQYPVGTEFEGATAVSPTIPAKLTTNLGTVTCDASIEGIITGAIATAVNSIPWDIKVKSWSPCTIGAEACTVTSINQPYSGQLATEGVNGNGSLTISSSGKGNPGFTVVCGAILNCTFTTASAKLAVSGGAAGVASIAGEEIAMSSAGSKCPTTKRWDIRTIINGKAAWVVM